MQTPVYTAAGQPAYGAGGPLYTDSTVQCCYLTELVCTTNVPTGFVAKIGAYDLSKIYRLDDGRCVYYGGISSPCIPVGYSARITAPSTPYADCAACANLLLQAYNCSNGLPVAGLYANPSDVIISTGTFVYRIGSGFTCYFFPGPAVATGTPATIGWLGPYTSCSTCATRSCGTNRAMLITISGVALDMRCHLDAFGTWTKMNGGATFGISFTLANLTATQSGTTAWTLDQGGPGATNCGQLPVSSVPFRWRFGGCGFGSICVSNTNSQYICSFGLTCNTLTGQWVPGPNLIQAYGPTDNINASPSPAFGWGIGGSMTATFI